MKITTSVEDSGSLMEALLKQFKMKKNNKKDNFWIC